MYYKNEFNEEIYSELKSLGISDIQAEFVIYHGDFDTNEIYLEGLKGLRDEFEKTSDSLLYAENLSLHALNDEYRAEMRKLNEEYEAEAKPLLEEIDRLKGNVEKMKEEKDELEADVAILSAIYHEVTGEEPKVEVEPKLVSNEEWEKILKDMRL